MYIAAVVVCLAAFVKSQGIGAMAEDQAPDVLQLYQLLDERADLIFQASQELGAAIDALRSGQARDFLKSAMGPGAAPRTNPLGDLSVPTGSETQPINNPAASTSVPKIADLIRTKRSYGRSYGYGQSSYGSSRGYGSGYSSYGGSMGNYGGYGGSGYSNGGSGYGGYGRYYG